MDAGTRTKVGNMTANAVESGKYSKCNKCGAEHDPSRCGASQQKCYNCKKVGHLSCCCPDRKDKSKNKKKF